MKYKRNRSPPPVTASTVKLANVRGVKWQVKKQWMKVWADGNDMRIGNTCDSDINEQCTKSSATTHVICKELIVYETSNKNTHTLPHMCSPFVQLISSFFLTWVNKWNCSKGAVRNFVERKRKEILVPHSVIEEKILRITRTSIDAKASYEAWFVNQLN